MNKSKLAVAILISQATVLGSVPVHSQVLEEVLVTARKRVENLMDAPVAVSVVSGSAMDQEGITNLEQLSAKVPSLQIGRSALASGIYIRGIGSGINAGFEQSVGMYMDGINQSRSRQFTLSMVDLARVEILRGPQSLLFGKNTVAGAIKVETNNPAIDDDFNGYIAADIEPEYGTARGTAVLSGGLTDNFAARLAVRYQETDGYVDNVLIDQDVQERDDTLARLTLAWEPSDTLRLVGKASYTEMDGVGIDQVNAVADPSLLEGQLAGQNQLTLFQVMGTIAAFETPGFTAATGSKEYESWTGNLDWAPYDEEKTEATQFSLRADWEVGQFTLTSLTGYSEFELAQQQDTDFHPGNVVGGLGLEDVDQFSQELRINSNFDGAFNFTAGLYYEEQDQLVTGSPAIDGTLGGLLGQLPASGISPTLPDLPLSVLGINSAWNGLVLTQLDPANAVLIGAEQDVIISDWVNESDNNTLAVFVEMTVGLTDALFLDIGGRYSEDEKRTHKTGAQGVGSPTDSVVVITPDGMPTGALDAQNTALVAASWGALGSYVHDQDLKRDESHFDPSVRLRWDANDDTMVYLSYTEGYKSGGFNASGDTANPDGTPGKGTEFEDEQAEAWELGVKTSFMDNRGRFSTTFFRTEIEDLQVTSFQGTNYIVSNAASLISQGVELETQFALTQEWEIGGALAYLDSEYDKYPDAPCTIYQVAEVGPDCVQDLSGERGNNAPEWSAMVYASYEKALGNNLLFRFNTDASYKDEYFIDGDLDQNALQDSYVKVNARLGLASANNSWEVAVYGRNLTDETTYSAAVDSPLSAGIYGHRIEEPLIIGLQGRYNF
ncbi:MAG: TonB-dependent receptor [Halioglobus sp.]